MVRTPKHKVLYILGSLSIIFLFSYCEPGKKENSFSITESDIKAVFDSAGVNGTFVLVKQGSKDSLIHDRKRAATRYIPASTFKIPNSLIALNEGVIRDDQQILKWDGKARWVDSWNDDHNLQSAFKNSVVWFYQDIARKVGDAKYREWLQKLDYGNQQTGPVVDSFWLNGNIRISALEQVRFLNKLYTRELPFSTRTYDIFIDKVFVYEQAQEYTWYGKTGWAVSPDPDIGWFVGIFKKANDVYLYALNIDMPQETDVPKRIEITRSIFKKAGLL